MNVRDVDVEAAGADPESEPLENGRALEHGRDRHGEADGRGKEEADHPLGDALELRLPDGLRARHVDEAHAGDKGAAAQTKPRRSSTIIHSARQPLTAAEE